MNSINYWSGYWISRRWINMGAERRLDMNHDDSVIYSRIWINWHIIQKEYPQNRIDWLIVHIHLHHSQLLIEWMSYSYPLTNEARNNGYKMDSQAKMVFHRFCLVLNHPLQWLAFCFFDCFSVSKHTWRKVVSFSRFCHKLWRWYSKAKKLQV